MQAPFSSDPASTLGLAFDNSFVRALPADSEPDNFRRQVHGACFSRVAPTPVSTPQLIAWSSDVARSIGLPERIEDAAALAGVFSGNRLSAGMDPYAACYGGHQFGSWAGQLGDGRAITLGEVLGENGARAELQLKGAGPTPYSRMGDGRAVLRSSVREFLCSEAMHHLGVPTTRALSLVVTGDEIVRDVLYDGNPRPEPGAIVCRVAPSFLRFGSFELFTARHDVDTLRNLVDYAIRTHFPELGAPSPDVYAAWFAEISRRTAKMIAHWMRVGFVHGVMNTDNMSVLGLTIDYGPYGWLDDYDPNWTPNTTDAANRRYRFSEQPAVAAWNLFRFASALHPLVGSAEPFEDGLRAYSDALEAHSVRMFTAKLGLRPPEPSQDVGDPKDPLSTHWLVNEGIAVLQATPTDMTIFYRALANVPLQADADDETLLAPLAAAYYEPDAITKDVRTRTTVWLRRLGDRVRADGFDGVERRACMDATNPCYVPRNYLAQLAIDDAEKGDPSLLHELLEVMAKPYTQQAGRERFAAKRPEWARSRVGCSMLSCSS